MMDNLELEAMELETLEELEKLEAVETMDTQWQEVEELYGFEFYEAVKHVTTEIDFIDNVDLEDVEEDSIYYDASFHSVADYIAQLTPEDILEAFGYYGYNYIYIDSDGAGMIVLG